jgi:hypothetical protein
MPVLESVDLPLGHGVSLFMGGESTPSRAVVRSAGHGFRFKANIMKEEFNRAGPVLHLLLRYTQALITQMAQFAPGCRPGLAVPLTRQLHGK